MNAEIATLKPSDIISQELTTTSLKVAESFGKQHKHILEKIDQILTQVSDSFGKPNFRLTEYIEQNNLGKDVAYRMYEITKDGFMLLVMGFTGAKAMQVKIAYINAFNWMADQLLAKQQPVALPEPPTITKAQQGELATIIANKSDSSGKPRAYYWSRYQRHFKIAGYKDTPADLFDEARDYLLRLEGDNNPIVSITQNEIDAMIADRVKAMEGDLISGRKDDSVPAPYDGRVTMVFNDGKLVSAYEEKRGSFNTNPETMAAQIMDMPRFTASQLKSIIEACAYRMEKLISVI